MSERAVKKNKGEFPIKILSFHFEGYTVEPPKKGHFGNLAFIPCREAPLSRRFFCITFIFDYCNFNTMIMM